MNKNIGFVGVGMMGANMARHLNDTGWDVTTVFDINTAAATELASEIGATVAGTLAEVTAAADVILTVVTNDVDMLGEIFSQTGANSRVLETDAEDMRDRDHECWFSAEHAGKDSGIAAEMAASVGVTAPLNIATIAQYQKMVELGLGNLDKSGVSELTFKGRALLSCWSVFENGLRERSGFDSGAVAGWPTPPRSLFFSMKGAILTRVQFLASDGNTLARSASMASSQPPSQS